MTLKKINTIFWAITLLLLSNCTLFKPYSLPITEGTTTTLVEYKPKQALLYLPNTGYTHHDDIPMGAARDPSYFHLVKGTLNVSGWFHPQKNYTDFKTFWDQESKLLKESSQFNSPPLLIKTSTLFKSMVGMLDTMNKIILTMPEASPIAMFALTL